MVTPVWLRRFGPGLLSGAADDDPSGIATYTIAGASTGYGLLWAALVTTPLMIVVQLMCARIGMVSGEGLGLALKRVMPDWLVAWLVMFVVLANTVNIAADFAGMSACAQLVTHLPAALWLVLFAALLIVVQFRASYDAFANVVKWLCITLLSYLVAAFVVHADWGAALRATIIPQIRPSKLWLTTFLAFLGTTITPYLFFWQASLEVEEKRKTGRHSRASRLGASPDDLRQSRNDVLVGMIFSNVVAWFIIMTAAATLYAHHITVQSVGDAARALRPLAGPAAEFLFAGGVIGAGLLAIPAIAGSSAFAVAEVLQWPNASLSARVHSAQPFYGIIAAGIILGVAADLFKVDAIALLFFSAIINGIVSIPLLIGMLIAGNRRAIVGEHRNSPIENVAMGITILLMTCAAAGLLFVH